MRHSTIFKSRRMALVWAAGILWTAYDFASSTPQGQPANGAANAGATDTADEPTDATGAPISPEDQQKLADAINNM